jgi:predicted protein tyrosine phosphatase
MIVVCPLSRVEEMVARHKPGRVVSLLDPDFEFPELGPAYAGRHLQLELHDVDVPARYDVAPSAEHVHRLLRFIGECGPDEILLIHCRAGISRSTAAAFIVACFLNPDVPERDLALALRRVAPFARPNQLMVAVADEVMARDGRMIDAIASTGRDLPWADIDENTAFELQYPG